MLLKRAICVFQIHPMFPNLELNGVSIERRSSVHFLNVTIDKNLKFNLHINNIVTKISKTIGILYKLRQYIPISTLKSIYYYFIKCYLGYCPVIFGNKTVFNSSKKIYYSHIK